MENKIQCQTYIDIRFDGENCSPKTYKAICNRVSLYGEIKAIKCYANFNSPSVKPWIQVCRDYGITPVQCDRLIKTKNTTDLTIVENLAISMCQEAPGIMVLVSGDSDFHSIVNHLRKKGWYVIGVGKEQSNNIYKKAFNEFWTIEELTKALQKKTVVIKCGVRKRPKIVIRRTGGKRCL